MPDLDTQLHLKMFELFKRKQRLNSRIERVLEILLSKEIYGLEWGNPDSVEPLKFVRDRYVLPYINLRLTPLSRPFVPRNKVEQMSHAQGIVIRLGLSYALAGVW